MIFKSYDFIIPIYECAPRESTGAMPHCREAAIYDEFHLRQTHRMSLPSAPHHPIGLEHRLDAPHRLADAGFVFDQGKAHVFVAMVTKADAG